MNNRRNVLILGIAVLIIVLVYYRDDLIVFFKQSAEISPTTNSLDVVLPGELSAVARYNVPGGEGVLRFILAVDNSGFITNVMTEDVLNPNASNEKLVKFSEGLLLTIKGKKLSDLKEVDRVGTSSLTTKAFNSALTELKAKL